MISDAMKMLIVGASRVIGCLSVIVSVGSVTGCGAADPPPGDATDTPAGEVAFEVRVGDHTEDGRVLLEETGVRLGKGATSSSSASRTFPASRAAARTAMCSKPASPSRSGTTARRRCRSASERPRRRLELSGRSPVALQRRQRRHVSGAAAAESRSRRGRGSLRGLPRCRRVLCVRVQLVRAARALLRLPMVYALRPLAVRERYRALLHVRLLRQCV